MNRLLLETVKRPNHIVVMSKARSQIARLCNAGDVVSKRLASALRETVENHVTPLEERGRGSAGRATAFDFRERVASLMLAQREGRQNEEMREMYFARELSRDNF